MTKERGTLEYDKPEPERPVARVGVTTDAELLPAVVGFVRQVAHRIGLRNKAAEYLDESVEAVCRNVIEHAFWPDEEGQYDVLVFHRPGQVVIVVEDQAYPSIMPVLQTMRTHLYQRCFTARSQRRSASSTWGAVATG